MSAFRDLHDELCSFENLFLAWKKARKHKTQKHYVIEFEKNLLSNLFVLQDELITQKYVPKPLKTFIIRDPKTRKISKSHFRDRIVHHALCNILEPIFEKEFIYDSYANRTGKGTLKAIERFDQFKRKTSKNNTRNCYVLKADIKKYFEMVDHNILINILKKRINDKGLLWLIKTILNNYSVGKRNRKGMPLGNLTSQFFANVYLNELDQFIKHRLKIKYYIRYVDDFVIFYPDMNRLKFYKEKIDKFLQQELSIELHADKSKIMRLNRELSFLGFRIFYYHKLLKKSNLRKMRNKFRILKMQYNDKKLDYDEIYDFFEGWLAYAEQADTYKLRKKFIKEINNLTINGEVCWW